MIILDTRRCPVELKYERGYEQIAPNTSLRKIEKDIFELKYKNNALTIRPYNREIVITGDTKEMALGLAMFIDGTLSTLDMGRDIINEAFVFSEKGFINGSWIIDKDMDRLAEFIDLYNNVYPTVLLLKD